MIDPSNITRYDRTTNELEQLLLFCVCVAGKTAKYVAKALDNLLISIHGQRTPFYSLLYFQEHDLASLLKEHGIGCYKAKSKAIYRLIRSKLDLKTCSIEDLENVYGIGPKTSRFFVLHSRPGVRIAVLDTHVLKFLRDNGIDAPKSTPVGKRYADLEKKFLTLADKSGKTPAEFDLEIWRKYSNGD